MLSVRSLKSMILGERIKRKNSRTPSLFLLSAYIAKLCIISKQEPLDRPPVGQPLRLYCSP